MIENLVMKKTMILEKPSGAVAITDPMSSIQRKFYNAFLYIAKKELHKDSNKQEFEIPLNELKKFFGIEDKKNTHLKEKIKELMKLITEYNILEKDKERWGAFTLLPYVEITIDTDTQAGIVKFDIPVPVKKAMINKKKNFFAKIDLVIIKGLKSKYAIILYELLKDYENVEIPEMDLKTFRKIFGVEDKYKIFPNLKKRVIEPAINEINHNKNIDWEVSYALLKTGVKYTYIKFKKVRKKQLEQQKITEKKQDLRITGLLSLVPEQYRSKAEKMLRKAQNLQNTDYIRAQIDYTNKQNPKNYLAYLATAIKEDYADHKNKAEREAKNRKKREELAKQEQETRKRLAELRGKMQKIEDEAEKEFSELPEEKKEKLMQKYMSLFANKNIAKMSAIGEIARLKMEKQMSKEDIEFLENHKNINQI